MKYSLNMAYTYIDRLFHQYDEFCPDAGQPVNAPGTQFKSTIQHTPGRHVPRVPTHMLNTTLNWQANSAFRIGAGNGCQILVIVDEINQKKLPGRTLFNLLANYDLKSGGIGAVKEAKWSLFARVDNLFDRNYWSTARGTQRFRQLPAGVIRQASTTPTIPPSSSASARTWYAGVSATF